MQNSRIARLRAKAPVTVFLLAGITPERKESLTSTEGMNPSPLPPDCVIPPGVYWIHHQAYDLQKEGLYRILHPLNSNVHRLVYQNNLDALCAGLCWLHTHGCRDDRISFEEAIVKALNEKLIMTCGAFSRYVHTLLGHLGIRSRVVFSRPLAEYDGFDSGHVMVEIWWGNRWVLWDADTHCFLRRAGRRLSLLEASRCAPSGDFEIEPIARSIPLSVSDFRGVDPEDFGYDYGLQLETTFCSLENLHQWHRRILHIPVLSDGQRLFVTGREEDRALIERFWPDTVFVSFQAFQKKFYGEE